jgi:hypothetical protein
MASRVANPNNFEYTARPALPEVLPLVLPGTWLLVIGALNLFYGISVLAGSHLFITTASWLVGDARPWGWLMVIVGIVQMAAGPAVWLRRSWAILVGVLSAVWHIVVAVMFASDSLVLSILLLLLDLTVLGSLIAGRPTPSRRRA